MIAVGGAVLTLIIVALVVRHGRAGSERTSAEPSRSADSTPVVASPAPAAAPSPTARGSTPTREADRTAARDGADSDRPASRTGAAAPGSGTLQPPAGPGVRRYAQTWANVRGDRTMSAPTVGMLNPGDAVIVDSLVRGWYRVLVDGRTLGYVHRSTLDVSRPE